MRRLGPRHLDTRRNLLPRDYFANPWLFGTADAELVLPPDGDETSQRIAWHTHQLVCAVRRNALNSTQACTRFGFSRDIWSEVCNGRRWPGETVLTAIIDTLADASRR